MVVFSHIYHHLCTYHTSSINNKQDKRRPIFHLIKWRWFDTMRPQWIEHEAPCNDISLALYEATHNETFHLRNSSTSLITIEEGEYHPIPCHLTVSSPTQRPLLYVELEDCVIMMADIIQWSLIIHRPMEPYKNHPFCLMAQLMSAIISIRE
jgi:hypothetical protein